MNIKHSIIIPTYDKLHLIQNCVDSILKYTTWEDKELIIVSNGCKQDTHYYLNYISKIHPFIKILIYPEPLGYASAVNKGILIARGDYITLFNNDAELIPADINLWIDRMMDPFILDIQCGISGPVMSWGEAYKTEGMVFCLVTIKKEVFDKIGLLDMQFSLGAGEDSYFSFKAKRYGYTIHTSGYERWEFLRNEPKYLVKVPVYHPMESSTLVGEEIPEMRANNTKTLEYKILIAEKRKITIFFEIEPKKENLLSVLTSSCSKQIDRIIIKSNDNKYLNLDPRIEITHTLNYDLNLDLVLTINKHLYFEHFCLENMLRNITHEYYLSSGVIDCPSGLIEQTFDYNSDLCLIDSKLYTEYPGFNPNESLLNGPKFILDSTAKTFLTE